MILPFFIFAALRKLPRGRKTIQHGITSSELGLCHGLGPNASCPARLYQRSCPSLAPSPSRSPRLRPRSSAEGFWFSMNDAPSQGLGVNSKPRGNRKGPFCPQDCRVFRRCVCARNIYAKPSVCRRGGKSPYRCNRGARAIPARPVSASVAKPGFEGDWRCRCIV